MISAVVGIWRKLNKQRWKIDGGRQFRMAFYRESGTASRAWVVHVTCMGCLEWGTTMNLEPAASTVYLVGQHSFSIQWLYSLLHTVSITEHVIKARSRMGFWESFLLIIDSYSFCALLSYEYAFWNRWIVMRWTICTIRLSLSLALGHHHRFNDSPKPDLRILSCWFGQANDVVTHVVDTVPFPQESIT